MSTWLDYEWVVKTTRPIFQGEYEAVFTCPQAANAVAESINRRARGEEPCYAVVERRLKEKA